MFQALKLGSYFAFPCIRNIVKEQLFTASGSQFQELIFEPDKLPGLSRNGPLDLFFSKPKDLVPREQFLAKTVHKHTLQRSNVSLVLRNIRKQYFFAKRKT